MLKDLNEVIKELRTIAQEAERIKCIDGLASIKYNLIFNDRISLAFHQICKENGFNFSYYDPDTSYEEDINAFCYAANDFVEKLEKFEK